MRDHNGGPAIGRPWNKNAPGASGDVGRLASVAAGGAVALFGLSRRSAAGVALAALGGSLALRGIMRPGADGPAESGQTAPGDLAAPPAPATGGMQVEKTVTILGSPEALYQYWRDFENLPRFMRHLESVTVTGERRSHWKAKAPAGASVEWDAETTQDQPNELIAWHSVEGSDVYNAGTVRFREAPGGRGTEVRVDIEYDPPFGKLGSKVAMLWREEPGQQIQDDLRHFKQVMETGDIVVSDATKQRGPHPARPDTEPVRL
jgi:uncharacterized membrane protein